MKNSFIETIRILNGEIINKDYHIDRVEQTVKDFDINLSKQILEKIIVPKEFLSSEVKMRIVYGDELFEVSFQRYKRRCIKSLKLVECDDISYEYKFENRDRINELLKRKGNCDDILIVRKGFITDTSFSNVVFFSQNNELITPNTYLLNGTKRRYLLDNNIIHQKEIRVDEIGNFKGVYLINALNDLEDNNLIKEIAN